MRNFKKYLRYTNGVLTNDNERQILAINDYLFELDFDREEEMRTEKPAVYLTQNVIVKKKELSLCINEGS